MYKACVLWLFALQWSIGQATVPLPPRTAGKNTNIDCTGVIAFSSTGSGPVHLSGLVGYKTNIVNLAETWNREVGVFTCTCPGLYQFSFSGFTVENTRMVLQKRLNNSKNWSTILATKPGGGSATIIFQVEYGDEVAVFLEGNQKKFSDRFEGGDTTSFSGYRIVKT